MRALSHRSLWTFAPWLPLLACGGQHDVSIDPVAAGEVRGADPLTPDEPVSGTHSAGLGTAVFTGGGTSGAAQPLSPALAPESSADCDPTPSPGAVPGAIVQTVCFFGEDDADVPAAEIEQVVEVVNTDAWVHIRLTLNPDFVDNTYGATAIGWGERETAEPGPDGEPPVGPPPPADAPPGADAPPPPAADAPPPPADAPPPAADAPPPPPPGPAGADAGAPTPPPVAGDAGAPPRAAGPGGERPDRGGRGPGAGPGKGKGKGGHTFDDLLGSDHAELSLLDATGAVAMSFRIDYVSASDAASSGFASLGTSGGEGRLISGDPAHVLASTTSIDRNLNACGLGSFTEDSPQTDELYTPNPAASDWDDRVSYEIWIATAAFGSAGFGSALIDNVHASPSKSPGDTVTVLPAPCPVDPDQPDAEPEALPAVLQTIR